ncbi:hypothetical protein F9U64_15490 [Gracilibacillus oryzae]|uniref:Yip1 domain-containing protein n=1 Tax=Gracilibacillus oryzae TaxID=1672701 RepID=A0A7C8KX41_9BACI|nr:hypothetical protein [Gracilibacillus oryzae]KAB8129187.1 hypothetical protein F9U64_15490 [Gracilibacillus oryzae]
MKRNTLLDWVIKPDTHLERVKHAEHVGNIWRTTILLILASFLIYGWMAGIGMGSALISPSITDVSSLEYNTDKFWFVIGRAIFGLIFAIIILFLISYYFYLVTELPYRKLVLMQQVVFMMMLVERIIWIPLYTYVGLDWYVSPFSFGIIASFFTDIHWIEAFFGSISLFQLWIIYFQAKFLLKLSILEKYKVWIAIILLHLFSYVLVTLLTYFDKNLMDWWF